MNEVRLTGWPPLATLSQAVLAAAAAVPVALWFVWVASRDYAKEPGRIIAIGILVGLPGLFFLLTFVRLAMRWLIRPSIRVAGDELIVRVRRHRWLLFDRLEERRIPLGDIRALRFETALRTSFTIDAASAQVRLPPAMFAIGPHSLDAAIRAHVPHERFPDPLGEVATLMRFRVSRGRRWVMRAIFVLPILLTVAGVATGVETLVFEVGMAFYIPWLIVGWLMLVCRGELILDARGLFHEYDGTVAFIAWPELDLSSVSERGHRGLANLEIRSTKRVRGTPTRIRLTRFLGLGFPNAEIGEAVRLVAAQYR